MCGRGRPEERELEGCLHRAPPETMIDLAGGAPAGPLHGGHRGIYLAGLAFATHSNAVEDGQAAAAEVAGCGTVGGFLSPLVKDGQAAAVKQGKKLGRPKGSKTAADKSAPTTGEAPIQGPSEGVQDGS